MIFTVLMSLISIFLDLLATLGVTKCDKDMEIIILRQQMRILQRKLKAPPRITDPERIILAALMDKYTRFSDGACQHLNQVMLIFKPDTVLRWHRELVHRKWTFKRKGKPGRPGISSELEALIVRLAKENSHWGYDKIQGELLKLGYKLCTSSVRNILMQHRVTPACERSSGSWRSFLGHYKDQILAFYAGYILMQMMVNPLLPIVGDVWAKVPGWALLADVGGLLAARLASRSLHFTERAAVYPRPRAGGAKLTLASRGSGQIVSRILVEIKENPDFPRILCIWLYLVVLVCYSRVDNAISIN